MLGLDQKFRNYVRKSFKFLKVLTSFQSCACFLNRFIDKLQRITIALTIAEFI